MSSKKPPLDDDLPPSLKGLPRFSITRESSSSRADAEREDVAFNIRSIRDLDKQISRGFTKSSQKKAPRK